MNAELVNDVRRHMAGQTAMAILFGIGIDYVRIDDDENGVINAQCCSSEIDMLIHVAGYVAEHYPRKVKFADGDRGEQMEALIARLAPNVPRDPNVWMRLARRSLSQCMDLVDEITEALYEKSMLDADRLSQIASESRSIMWGAQKELMKVLKTRDGVVVA